MATCCRFIRLPISITPCGQAGVVSYQSQLVIADPVQTDSGQPRSESATGVAMSSQIGDLMRGDDLGVAVSNMAGP